MDLQIHFAVRRRIEKMSLHTSPATLDEALMKFRADKAITESRIF